MKIIIASALFTLAATQKAQAVSIKMNILVDLFVPTPVLPVSKRFQLTKIFIFKFSRSKTISTATDASIMTAMMRVGSPYLLLFDYVEPNVELGFPFTYAGTTFVRTDISILPVAVLGSSMETSSLIMTSILLHFGLMLAKESKVKFDIRQSETSLLLFGWKLLISADLHP